MARAACCYGIHSWCARGNCCLHCNCTTRIYGCLSQYGECPTWGVDRILYLALGCTRIFFSYRIRRNISEPWLDYLSGVRAELRVKARAHCARRNCINLASRIYWLPAGFTYRVLTSRLVGSVVRTRTVMACYASIYPREGTWPALLRATFRPSRTSSTVGPAKCLDSRRPVRYP